MNLKNIAFTLLILLTGCSKPNTPKLAPEALYHDDGLSVITSFFNSRRQTITVLYGNTTAQQAANAGHVGQSAGEDYRLVVWEQYPNPLWFGSNINGRIKSVERLTTITAPQGNITTQYSIVQGSVTETITDSPGLERTAYIYSLKAMPFPGN